MALMIFDADINAQSFNSSSEPFREWDGDPLIGCVLGSEIGVVPRNAQCGKKKCGPQEQCFVHRISALQSTYQFLARLVHWSGR